MADFEFQPWERLSDDVTDGQADLRQFIKGRGWLFRQCGEIWFTREEKKRGREWNFALCSIPNAVSSLGVAWTMPQPKNFARFVSDGWHGHTLGRVLKLSDEVFAGWLEDKGWALFERFEEFAREEGSTPLVSRPKRKTVIGFELPSGSQTPSSAIFSSLQDRWQNSPDLAFAVHFASLSDLERRLHGVQTRIGTPIQFASLIRAALCAFAPRWPGASETVQLDFCANGGQGRFTLAEGHPFGVRESAILGHIVRAFEPRQLADSPDLPLALRTLTEGGWSRSFSIQVARPSMHDRLEAMLELRAWLETHWPDGVKHLGKVV